MPPDGGGELVLLGLGANLADPVGQLARAVRRLRGPAGLTAVSSVYRSEPVGYRSQPDFYNVVAAGRTRLAPEELLAAAHRVEEEMGRVRTFADAPRVIDVDLLAVGDARCDGPSLRLPHPRLHLRGFVLHPLAEVAPEWRHPVLGLTAREMLAAAGELERVVRWGPLSADLPGGGGAGSFR